MGKLIASGIVSADGYSADERGEFGWAAPDPEVHGFVNDQERGVATYVYGRRMYEVMRFWADVPDLESEPPEMRDYADLWARADKVVFSRTLDPADITTEKTTLLGEWDDDVVRRLTAKGDVSIGGPTITGEAWRSGLVDEVRLISVPYVTGGGTPFFAPGVAQGLRLLETRSFESGAVFTRYATCPRP